MTAEPWQEGAEIPANERMLRKGPSAQERSHPREGPPRKLRIYSISFTQHPPGQHSGGGDPIVGVAWIVQPSEGNAGVVNH